MMICADNEKHFPFDDDFERPICQRPSNFLLPTIILDSISPSPLLICFQIPNEQHTQMAQNKMNNAERKSK